MTVYKYTFDFELGTLAKSPCRECEKAKEEFPRCIDSCEVLHRLQWLLAETRRCTRS